jgi:hypothetical protein
LAFVRPATSTASRHAFTKTSTNSCLPVVSDTFQLSPPSITNTPIVRPRFASRSPICCCSAIGRFIMPLSSNARKPASAMNRI